MFRNLRKSLAAVGLLAMATIGMGSSKSLYCMWQGDCGCWDDYQTCQVQARDARNSCKQACNGNEACIEACQVNFEGDLENCYDAYEICLFNCGSYSKASQESKGIKSREAGKR
jgi:hypothetical protein